MTPHQHIPPAQLWFGQHEQLKTQAQEFLQKKLCASRNTCGHCAACAQVITKQHHAVMWLEPEKNYTLEQLEPIFNTISFSLAQEQHYFFIIQKADMLTTACANSLLKSMEEPPNGYHFILLAERQDTILPTIRSRCIVQSFFDTNAPLHSPLFAHFATIEQPNALLFMKDLDQSAITERESIGLIDVLLKHWVEQYKAAIVSAQEKQIASAHRIITMLQNALLLPPMPGSSKLFLKNLFLQIHHK